MSDCCTINVPDLACLANLDTTGLPDGALVFVEELHLFFFFDSTSDAVVDGDFVIGARFCGRFIQMAVSGTAFAELSSSVQELSDIVLGEPHIPWIDHAEELWPSPLGPLPRTFDTGSAPNTVFLSRISALSTLAPNLGALRIPNINAVGGTWWRNAPMEPSIAVNPVDPLNMICGIMQDQWSPDASGLGNVTFYTKDGGQTWNNAQVWSARTQNATVPWSTTDFMFDADPNVGYDQHGVAYALREPYNRTGSVGLTGFVTETALAFQKSHDGGLSWTKQSLVTGISAPARPGIDRERFFHDRNPTGDINRNTTIYITWNEDLSFVGGTQQFQNFARSRDSGNTWDRFANEFPNPFDPNEGPFLPYKRVYFFPQDFNAIVWFGWSTNIVVLNDGDLLMMVMVNDILAIAGSPGYFVTLRSSDQGDTWTPSYPQAAPWPPPSNPVNLGVINMRMPEDPETGILLEASPGVLGSYFAYNPARLGADGNGTIYMIFGDTRFSTSGLSANVVITMSEDSGVTWTTPVPIKTGSQDTQPSMASIAVNSQGRVGVIYLDTTNYVPGSGQWQGDYFLTVFDATLNITDEIRVTPDSFDIRQAIRRDFSGIGFGFPYFLGDFIELQSDGVDFVSAIMVTNKPYGIGPAPAPAPPNNGSPILVDERRRQDAIFARINGPF